ncbi:MAG: alternate F1F0 ATPase, F1 subunit alpha [Gammaproteobacteria bacterium]
MLNDLVMNTAEIFEGFLEKHTFQLTLTETGTVTHVGQGVALVEGLPGVRAQELVEFTGGNYGLAFNLDPEQLGVVLLCPSERIAAGSRVRRTGRVADVPVGMELLGRVVNGLGQPLDGQPSPSAKLRWPMEREAPAILDRAPVSVPLHTGIKVIDAAIPIGRGQRQLIIGDRQTGKTTIALDTLLNQRGTDVLSVYCAIGQRGDSVARVIQTLREQRALDRTVIVTAAAEDPPGLQFITPYAATSIGEYFMKQGRDVLIVYDDLTRHAMAYRELSLLLRRPPGREAYPGDIFYVHSRLLERSTRLAGGGSMTAFPICEIEAQNLAAYIPTNLISITDGQIYLSPELFHKSMLPAVDVGKSVSRVGGKAQLQAFRSVAGALKLYYAQFEELEMFARFGTRLDEKTKATLERGKRVREILQQKEHKSMPPFQQITVLLAVTEGLFDKLPLHQIAHAEETVVQSVTASLPDLGRRMDHGEKLTAEDRETILNTVRRTLKPGESNGD